MIRTPLSSLHFAQWSAKQQWLKYLLPGFLVICLISLLAGCISLQTKSSSAANAIVKAEPVLSRSKPEAFVEKITTHVEQEPSASLVVNTNIWKRLRERFRFWHISHERIDKEIKRLQANPAGFTRLMRQAAPYLYFIIEKIEQENLPGELALMPAIESGFKPYASSPGGAAGLWQFMPATGRMMGLTQDWWYDGRRDIVAATDAALRYLVQLNTRLDGEWLHTLASYNAGISKVKRAIHKAKQENKDTSFWHLELPAETDNYIPRILALAAVVENPDYYDLVLPNIENAPYFEVVPLDNQLDLHKASQLAAVPLEELRQLNPGFKRWATHPHGSHHLLLPSDKAEQFQQALIKLPKQARLSWRRYTIQNGDSLSVIAERHNVSVSAIRQANKLDSNRIRAGKVLLIPLSKYPNNI